jgi:hypothetical protein
MSQRFMATPFMRARSEPKRLSPPALAKPKTFDMIKRHKQANEFGLSRAGQTLISLLVFDTDVHSSHPTWPGMPSQNDRPVAIPSVCVAYLLQAQASGCRACLVRGKVVRRSTVWRCRRLNIRKTSRAAAVAGAGVFGVKARCARPRSQNEHQPHAKDLFLFGQRRGLTIPNVTASPTSSAR